MQTESPVALVQAWQEAANDKDADRLVALSDSNIEIVGPRGSSYGSQVLSEWLERAGLTLTTLRVFARGPAVVVEQHGVWRAPETNEVTGDRILASSFRVENGSVTRYVRLDDLDTALNDAGLERSDEVIAG
jgi:hypothetical protein